MHQSLQDRSSLPRIPPLAQHRHAASWNHQERNDRDETWWKIFSLKAGSFLLKKKREKKVGKVENLVLKEEKRSKDLLWEKICGNEQLDRPWISARPFAELDQVQFGERPSWIEHGFSSAVRGAGLVQLGKLPSWIERGFSSAVRGAGSNLDSARLFAELDRTRIQLGRSPSWTNPVRRMPELDRPESVFTLSL
ncbi:hypothetical protein DY000_02021623 [Brassica cretica]|uniref:Uncharacterized protein n=1 Tax=Brassica cretica TaxID=69181 RepID=A0ABQ7ELB5_BRACR|nr:hypothetical protein DY000_02021623 [Brassica cretica]